MSKINPEYKTDVEETLGMIGYDRNQPALLIESPAKAISLSDDGLVEIDVWGWVKMSANFIYHIGILKGAKLSVFQVIALSIDKDGRCRWKIKDIAALTKYSRSEVIESLGELEELGYLSIQKESGKSSIYDPAFVARGENQPVPIDPSRKTTGLVPPFESADDQSSPASGNYSTSINRVKRVNKREKPGNAPDFSTMTAEEAYRLPTLRMYRKATGFFPGQLAWEFVHNFIIEFGITEDKLKLAAMERKINGFKSEDINGILKWARDGIPQNIKSEQAHPRPNSKAKAATALELLKG